MRRCPKCGNKMNTKHCLVCDYVEKDEREYCPECGEVLNRGVCYRCGYRSKNSHNTCPYCREKLIGGRCDRCNYIKPFAHTENRIKETLIIIAVFVAVVILLGVFY